MTKPNKLRDDIISIIDSLTDKDKRNLGFLPGEDEYLSIEQEDWIIQRFLLRKGGLPIAFFDVLGDSVSASVALAVRRDYQGQGYGSMIADIGSNWIDEHINEFDHVEWNVRKGNIASARLARQHGWTRWRSRDYKSAAGEFMSYVKSVDLQ